MQLLVITASVRDIRVGGMVGRWITEYAEKHARFNEVKHVDLRELNLPVFAEPNHPAMQQYEYDYTKNWSKIVDEADAILFVIPEYNYFAPGSIVNAIDYLAKEWNYKAAGIVSYGGVSGGLRSAQSLKPLLTTVKMMPMSEGVAFQFVNNNINDDHLVPNDIHISSADALLVELARWTEALTPLRRPAERQ